MNKEEFNRFTLEDIVEIITDYIEDNISYENKLHKKAIFLIKKKGYFDIEDFGKIKDIINKCNNEIQKSRVNYMEILSEDTIQRFQNRVTGKIEEEYIFEINRKYMEYEIRSKISKYSNDLVKRICTQKLENNERITRRKIATKELSNLDWIINTINFYNHTKIHKFTSMYFHKFKNEYKDEYIKYLENKSDTKTDAIMNSIKLKWNSDGTDLGFIFREISRMGYFDYPSVKSGSTLLIAEMLKRIFDIKESANSIKDTLSMKKESIRVNNVKSKFARKIEKFDYGSDINYHVDNNQIFCIPNRNIIISD